MNTLQLIFCVGLLVVVVTSQTIRCRRSCRVKIGDERVCKDVGETWNKTKSRRGYFHTKMYECVRVGRRYRSRNVASDKYCLVNGQRHEVDDVFMNSKKRCNSYKCGRRIRRQRRITPGCRRDNQCYAIGETWVSETDDGMFKFSATCMESPSRFGRRGRFGDIVGECFSVDEWKKSGEIWNGGTGGCTVLTCKSGEASNSVAVDIVSYGCRLDHNDTCVKVGDTWDEGCNTWGCSHNGTHSITAVQTHKCELEDGSCVAEGGTWNIGCNTLVCQVDGKNTGPTVQTYGCKLSNGTCVEEGVTWNSGCNTMVCQVNGNRVGPAVQSRGCAADGGGCKNEGDSWDEGCATRTCTFNGTHTIIKSALNKCALENGSCVDIGDTWREGCEVRICSSSGDGSAPSNDLHIFECTTSNGTCVPHDGTWMDYTECAEFKCQINGNEATSAPVKKYCKDIQTKECKDDGESVLMSHSNGSLLSCTCETGISISKGTNCVMNAV